MPSEKSSDYFKILIATDIHLGYDEKDPLRCRDSINTFEEILQIAQKSDVDFILLGGDLFHENKPSRFVMYECVRLIRLYCMSNKPVQFEFVSDASINFSHSLFPHVNYEDENLNVGMPIFTINGNHDDVTGQNLCALDVLHESGLLNYFGKYTNIEKIEVSPILLRKSGVQLAMYGLGAIRDERLHRMFLSNQVKFLTFPGEGTQTDEWFNLFVLHQNRVKHGLTNYIPDKMLPDFLDLVIWGHEHPCGGEAEDAGNFHILQPGSSVATSLAEGESGDKHVFILKIKNAKDFKLEKIKLRTVRQFYYKEIVLAELGIKPGKHDTNAKIVDYCNKKVLDFISLAENERSGHEKQPKEPLIRLSIDYSGDFETFNSVRFGHNFIKEVGNPKDMLIFHKRRQESKAKVKVDRELMDRLATENPEDLLARVEDMVKLYFADVETKKQMLILTERGMGDAMKNFVDKEEKDSLQDVFTHQLDRCKQRLKREQKNLSDENEIHLVLEQIQQLRLAKDKQTTDEDQKDAEIALEQSRKRKREEIANGADEPINDDDDEDVTLLSSEDENGFAKKQSTSKRGKSTTPKGRGTGAPRGRVSRGKRATK